MTQQAARTRPYHHGHLKSALVDAAIALIEERGVRSFSLAEVSRRLGVSVSAPYRHFPDRDALLAAVVGRAFEILGEMLDAESAEAEEPAEQLAAAAAALVRFAAANRALFEALFFAGMAKTRPELQAAGHMVGDAFMVPAHSIAGDAAGDELAIAVVATAHGFAALLLEGVFGRGDDAVAHAAGHATAATAALVEGRARLTP